MSKRRQILKQLYDVKPTKADGSLDLEKIAGSERIIRIKERIFSKKISSYKEISDVRKSSDINYFGYSPSIKFKPEEKRASFSKKVETQRPNIVHLGEKVSDNILSISKIYIPTVFSDKKTEEAQVFEESFDRELEHKLDYDVQEELVGYEKTKSSDELDIMKSTDDLLQFLESERASKRKRIEDQRSKFLFSDIFSTIYFLRKGFSQSFSFVATILVFSTILPSLNLIQKGFETKDLLSGSGESVLGELAVAKDNLSSGQFEKASSNFEQSYEILKNANSEISKLGGDFSEFLRFIPGVSKIATANYLLGAGENISLAGKIMTDSVKSLTRIENPLNKEADVSLAELFLSLRDGIREATNKLKAANEDILKANFSHLPLEIQPQFLDLKKKLPVVISSLDSFSNNSNIMLDMLGYNGPRKFLFLFQNNQEMRATGGFIGSYGILDTSEGRIKNLFVDDIYNPDGKLPARVLPPEPIQKMSAVWTMHDANWFPDFPASAEKVAWFYEKTGGPNVEGVIAVTPEPLQDFLEITGPIDMPEYETTVDADNFIEKTQYEVEIDYDREENRPKKFIADLMPKVLDKLLNTKDPKTMLRALNIFGSAPKEN